MKSYRSPAMIFSVALVICLLAVNAHASDKAKKAPPPKPANQYAAFDAHPNEHVTVAAEPCDDPKDCEFFRLPYNSHGFLPVRVIFTNYSDNALTLDDARIQFISANNDKIPAATDDDIQRRLFSTKSVKGREVPLPLPLPPIHLHDKPVDKQITEDDNDFGFTTSTVKPHSTLAGYLLYDTHQLNDQPLKGAEIYIKMVYTVPDKNGEKKQLFDFNIPFDKWLAAQSTSQPTPKTTP